MARKKESKTPSDKPKKSNRVTRKRRVKKSKSRRTVKKEVERQSLIQRIIGWFKKILKSKKRAASSARDEFRYNHNTKHPNYIFEEKDGKRRGVGITHEETTHGRKNMPLKKNPQKGDTRKAYVRYGTVKGKSKYYSQQPSKNMSFGKEDKANVKSKVRNYKTRTKRGQKKNKKGK